MDRKVALVTGGTSGIGLSLLPVLVQEGFFVHFVGRNVEKGLAVESELNADGEVARFVRLDLGDLGAVKGFTAKFREEVPSLDLLANVAGVMLPERQVTSEGIETTFAIGYLSVYLLCTELQPALANAPNARIVNVAGVRRFVLKQSLDLDDLGFEKNYKGMAVAIKTIHAKTVLTEILAERLHADGITVNSFHPGAVKGDVGRNAAGVMKAVFAVANLFMAKTSKSAVHVATSAEVAGVTGQYFVGRTGSPLQFESTYKDELWRRTVEMVGGPGR